MDQRMSSSDQMASSAQHRHPTLAQQLRGDRSAPFTQSSMLLEKLAPLPPFWQQDTPEANAKVKFQVENLLDRVLTKVEKQANADQRKQANADQRSTLKEREKREREVRRQAQQAEKAQQLIDREVRCTMERLIKRVERACEKPPASDGTVYIVHGSGRMSNRPDVYKVRGVTCKEWFEPRESSFLRAQTVEQHVKQAIKQMHAVHRKRANLQKEMLQKEQKELIQKESMRKEAIQKELIPKEAVPKEMQKEAQRHFQKPPAKRTKKAASDATLLEYSWLHPDGCDGNWARIHLRIHRSH